MRRKNQVFRSIKNKIISIVCMVSILLTNMSGYAKVFAYEKNDYSEITVNDQDLVIMDDKNLRKTESMENLNWIRDMNPNIGNIDITNGGKKVEMTGNPTTAGKNAIYIIPEVPQEQTLQFDYNIDYGDSFSAAGVLMGVRATGDYLEGLMLSFNNSDGQPDEEAKWYYDAGEKNAAIWQFTYKLNNNYYDNISKHLIKALDIPKSGKMQVKIGTNELLITGSNINETVSKPFTSSYGFGFFSTHYNHECLRIGSFKLENCVYTEINLVPHNLYVDPNGGTWRNSSSVTTLEGIEGDTCSIGVPVRSGYTFTGWKRVGTSGTMSSLTGNAIYTFGEEEDKLIAQWEEIKVPHNLYVDPNGGTWRNTSNVTTLSGIAGSTSSIEVPVRSGYTFTGWKRVGNSGTMSSLTGNAVYTFGEEDHRLIAQWIKIEATKQSNITTGKVRENQEITYTITATNTGTVNGNVVIKDAPPEGTTFVPNSITINGAPSSNTQQNLANGINVAVPKPDTGQSSKSSTLSFKVRVNKLTNNALIKNTAQYKDVTVSTNSQEKTTNEIVVKYVEPIISQSKSQLTQNKESFVVNGEKVTYTINVSNDGGLSKEVVVKDTIPEGTTFVTDSVKINGVSNSSIGEMELKNGVNMTIPEQTLNQTISFDVIINDINDEDIIRNIAIVDEQQTNEVTLRYVEPIITQRKKMETENNLDYVVNAEKIKYTIIVENAGGLAKDVVVKDLIPEGTTLVEGSVKINDQTALDGQEGLITKEQLENGITINSPKKITKTKRDLANSNMLDVLTDTSERDLLETSIYEPSTTTVSFEVMVNDINDEDIILNTATVDENSTNTVSIKYVEPIIDQKKEIETENNLDYVVNGEKIKYTITVENAGGLAKDVVVKDLIPEGTTFVEGSVKINNETALDEQENQISKEQLENGVTINSPKKITKEKNNPVAPNRIEVVLDAPEDLLYEPSVTTISFEVMVNDIEDEDIISNTATVDENKTNEVSIKYIEPIISQKKEMETENNLDYVVYGEKIKYIITVENTGSLAKDVMVKDVVPEGTTFVEESVKINDEVYEKKEGGKIQAKDLEEGFTFLVPQKTKDEVSEQDISGKTTMSFEVMVNDIEDEDIISNTARVDENETNEVSIKYIEPIINAEKVAKTQYNKDYVTGEETITYNIIVNNEGSLEKKVVIKDEIPEGVTFVKNSIKVNDEPYQNETDGTYDESDLKKGIEVLVPPKEIIDTEPEALDLDKENDEKNNNHNQKGNEQDEDSNKEKENEKNYTSGKTTLSFEVTVNKLKKDTDTAKIVNIATVDEEETNEVTHQVLPFNMKIEERIKEVTLNGAKQNVGNGKMMKTEVHAKTVNTASVITKYNIVVTNTGKVEGTATIQESIPEGYKIANTNPNYWKSTKDGKLQTTTEVIKPGESKNLEVALTWQNGSSNFGKKVNTAEIIQTSNASHAPETTLQDNKSESTILMSIRTGEINNNNVLIGIATVSSTLLIFGIIFIKKKVLG